MKKFSECTYRVISSVLTARGVPGGTVANTFDEAYLDAGSIICVIIKNHSAEIEHNTHTQTLHYDGIWHLEFV